VSTLATPLPNAPAQPARPKNWFQRHWVLALIGGCVALMILFAGFIAALFAVVEGSLKSSDACTQALAQARSNPHVVEKFGQPMQPGWFISGNIQVSGPSGNADISIPISGPRAKGTIYVVAKKSAGRWRFDTLEVEAQGEQQRINLLPATTPVP
jgi:hypothetical protein